MLHLIYGRAGSGKTTYLQELCLRSARERPEMPLYYIVPEQYSFETERAMLHLLGPKDAQKVHVLSFSRMAEEVFRRFGGAAGRRLEAGGRCIFMSLALEQVKEHLKFYRRKAETTDMISMLLAISEELKLCAVRPETLGETAASLPEGTLRRKMKELSLILGAYDALVAESCVDPLEDLTRVQEPILVHGFFRDSLILVDTFTSFTVQEYGILRLMMKQAADIHITLCADSPQDPENGVGLFSLVQRTGVRLKNTARENDVPVAAPVILPPSVRFRSEALRALEESAYRPSKRTYEGAAEVTVYRAADLYDEAEFVAASIRNLVMEEGYHYGDFTIIARHPEEYASMLEESMAAREIPLFMDDPRPVESEPLMRLVLSALQAIRWGWRTEEISLLMKTGLTPLTEAQIANLENYAFLWTITGEEWLSPWKMHPRGFEAEMTEEDTKRLQELEECRKLLLRPLQVLEKILRRGTGEECAAAVFALLESWKVSLHLKEMAARLEEAARPDLAERQLRSWDLLMEVLDQCALVMKEFSPGIARFSEILRLVIASGTLSSIPQGLDQVTVGGADRMRPVSPKVVFLLGARQGEFPAAAGSGGIFSGLERQELIRLGLPLNETLEGTAVQERFLAYTALSSPSEKLFISYPGGRNAGQGAGGEPSSLILEAEAVLPNLRHYSAESLPPLYFANAEAPAFHAAARSFGRGTVYSATLAQCFQEKAEYEERLAALKRAADASPEVFRTPELAEKLFGKSMNLSATQIETYHLCRFQYFCRYGLHAKERRAASMDALEYGSLMHYLLEKAFREVGAETILHMEAAALEETVRGLLNRYGEEKLGGMAQKSARFHWMMERLVKSAAVIIAHIARELSQSLFVPVEYELSVGKEGIPPLTIPLPNGGSVQVEGKIDRVDLFEKNGKTYLRVVDYKTGKKDFRLSDVVYGVNMQMLVYLAALAESGNGRYGGEAVPAGILYMPATDPRVTADRNLSPEKALAEQEKSLRMKGLLIDDPEVLSAMEPDGYGTYIPVMMKNGAPSRRDSVVTQREMEKILRYIRKTVGEMARELQGGRVEALPLKGGYDACAWCPYRAVCGHEEEDPGRETEKWDRSAVLKFLCGEDEED